MPQYEIGRPARGGFIDVIDVEPTGVIRVSGWCERDPDDIGLELTVNTGPVQPFAQYRTHRPDVARHLGREQEFLGFAAEFLARPCTGAIERIDVSAAGKVLARIRRRLAVVTPPYDHLFMEKHVLGRDGIYGFGPPATEVSSEVLALTERLPGPSLDFGCGSGALLRRLRERGVDARGLEIDRPGIAGALAADVRPYIHLYAGGWPTPFEDGAFRSATAVEVLEHLERPELALEEIRRVTREQFIATVPDMSAIPALSRHGVVPWHLLESTHVSFFTQASFTALLRRFFERIEVRRVGRLELNDTVLYTGLAAVCYVESRAKT